MEESKVNNLETSEPKVFNRRLTSLWQARRNKSMINKSIKEDEECKSSFITVNEKKKDLDERMRQQSRKMRQCLEQRRRIRSHDTQRFNGRVISKINNIFVQEASMKKERLVYLSKSNSQLRFQTISEEDAQSSCDNNRQFMTARNSLSQFTKNRPNHQAFQKTFKITKIELPSPIEPVPT